MSHEFRLDARRWRFLDNAERYIEEETGGLSLEPLERQFKTAKEILARFADGRGVLLADDVGLGKTTIGSIVAWVVACQDKRVRIYAPNEVLRRRWAEELERHVKMLARLKICAHESRIKQGKVEKLTNGRIQVATHHDLVRSHSNNEQRAACDLMIIDEAHRAKGDGSAFNDALRKLGGRAKRKLILTATPFSIRITELEQLLKFVGATKLNAVRRYARELARLYLLGEGHDIASEALRLTEAASEAIEQLRPYVIRHGVDGLPVAERRLFEADGTAHWKIPTSPASNDDLNLLLRMDRLLHLAPERSGERRNDPRFHVGWHHMDLELKRAAERTSDGIAQRHIQLAAKALRSRRQRPHPKIGAVSASIRPIVDAGEKVLIFCHHRATAAELLIALERSLCKEANLAQSPPLHVWRAAWEGIVGSNDEYLHTIVEWLSTPGVRAQVGDWIGIRPSWGVEQLRDEIITRKPRHAGGKIQPIGEWAQEFAHALLDRQSGSTRAVLRNIARGTNAFRGGKSRFPGLLDHGMRVMGAWHHEGDAAKPKTLYTGKSDMVLAIFNSPFGPDVLVTTDHLSEGVDLHRCCRHVVHYELDPSPIRTLQRNGRIRRVNSWSAMTERPIQYAFPIFAGTRDEKAVDIMRQRVSAFGLLLGGVPSLDENADSSEENFAETVLSTVQKDLSSLNRRLRV